jgi:hypothetical protein
LPRLLPTVLILAVLTGSAVAFAVSESLKLEKRPITPTTIDKVFSPVCRCPQARARIGFRLRKPDTVSLSIIDTDGRTVRHLLTHRRLAARRHDFTWNGRDDGGRLLPEGSYKPTVELSNADRTFVLQNPIRIDVTRPHVRVLEVQPRVFSPDGDGRSDRVTVGYRVSEHANVRLLVNGRQRVRPRFKPLRGHVQWYGRIDGRKLFPGTYGLALLAVDPAGNRSRSVPAGTVRLRYLEVDGTELRAQPGQALRVPVGTDAPVVRWTVRRGSSVVARGKGAAVTLRAPRQPGRYALVIDAVGHQRQLAVVVQK